MNYKHKWVNDDSRYVVLIHGRQGVFCEFVKLTDARRKLETIDRGFINNRYTEQQLELEALNEGWVLFEIGCGDVSLSHNSKLHIDVCSADGNTFHFTPDNGSLFSGTSPSPDCVTVAWRLSNADGYKEGVKVEPKTPVSCEICHHEWTAIKGNEETEPCPGCHDAPLSVNTKTELPAIGSKVKLAHSFPGFTAMTGDSGKEVVILSHTVAPNGAKVAVYCSENCNIGAISGIAVAQAFDPIQSERDKVIAKAHSVIDLEWDYFRNKRFEDLYDAGMLTMPDKENK